MGKPCTWCGEWVDDLTFDNNSGLCPDCYEKWTLELG